MEHNPQKFNRSKEHKGKLTENDWLMRETSEAQLFYNAKKDFYSVLNSKNKKLYSNLNFEIAFRHFRSIEKNGMRQIGNVSSGRHLNFNQLLRTSFESK